MSREHWDLIISDAYDHEPYECCGLLGGEKDVVHEVFPVPSRTPDPDMFIMDPDVQIAVLQIMEHEGLDLVGVYHSHTTRPATPSGLDVKMYFYSEVPMVIVSVAEAVPSIRAWRIEADGATTEEPIEIVDAFSTVEKGGTPCTSSKNDSASTLKRSRSRG